MANKLAQVACPKCLTVEKITLIVPSELKFDVAGLDRANNLVVKEETKDYNPDLKNAELYCPGCGATWPVSPEYFPIQFE